MTTSAIECDIIESSTGRKLRTVKVTVVPRENDEIDLDLGGKGADEGLYRVVRVRHHFRPRKIVLTEDLIGVSLYVELTS